MPEQHLHRREPAPDHLSISATGKQGEDYFAAALIFLARRDFLRAALFL